MKVFQVTPFYTTLSIVGVEMLHFSIHSVFICSRNTNLKIYKNEKIVNRNKTDQIRINNKNKNNSNDNNKSKKLN